MIQDICNGNQVLFGVRYGIGNMAGKIKQIETEVAALKRISHEHEDNREIKWSPRSPAQGKKVQGRTTAEGGGDGGGSGEITNIINSANIPLRITGGGPGNYTVGVYANGKDQPATGTGILQILQINFADIVSAGTWVIGQTSVLTIDGE
jgi:hypothetical protein